jgi:hypothetical protein
MENYIRDIKLRGEMMSCSFSLPKMTRGCAGFMACVLCSPAGYAPCLTAAKKLHRAMNITRFESGDYVCISTTFWVHRVGGRLKRKASF